MFPALYGRHGEYRPASGDPLVRLTILFLLTIMTDFWTQHSTNNSINIMWLDLACWQFSASYNLPIASWYLFVSCWQICIPPMPIANSRRSASHAAVLVTTVAVTIMLYLFFKPLAASVAKWLAQCPLVTHKQGIGLSSVCQEALHTWNHSAFA